MTVYASTAALARPRELWAILAAFRSAGIEAAELGHAAVPDSESLVERLCDAGMRYLVHNYFPPPREEFVVNLASSDPEIARRSLALVSDALALAAAVGSPLYAVHSGFITDPIDFDGTSYVLPAPASVGEVEQAQARFLSALEQAVTRAEELGLTLLIENSVCTEALRGKLLALEAEDIATIFERIDTPSFGLLLDTGHLNVTATTLGFDRARFVERVAPYVRAWHVHSNDGISDSHHPVEPGSWVHGLLLRPEFARLPITIEAKFATVDDLATHVRWWQHEVVGDAGT